MFKDIIKQSVGAGFVFVPYIEKGGAVNLMFIKSNAVYKFQCILETVKGEGKCSVHIFADSTGCIRCYDGNFAVGKLIFFNHKMVYRNRIGKNKSCRKQETENK